eukprot:1170686-Pyramimonas_sp.AAC.1
MKTTQNRDAQAFGNTDCSISYPDEISITSDQHSDATSFWGVPSSSPRAGRPGSAAYIANLAVVEHSAAWR